MNRILFFLSILLSHYSGYLAQEKITNEKIKIGDYIHEELEVQLISKKGVIKIPENYLNPVNTSHYIYHRYINGNIEDNEDSLILLKKVAHKIENLDHKGGTNHLFCHLVIYFFEKEESQNKQILNSIILSKNQSKSFSQMEFAILDTAAVNPHSFSKGNKIILTDKNHKIINMWSSVLAFASYYSINIDKKPHKNRKYSGKLFDNSNNKPINLATISLLNNKSDTISKTETDKHGAFHLRLPEEKDNYILNISTKDKNIQTILLTTKEGKEISKLYRGANGFEYKLIQADIERMAEIEEKEDISASFQSFKLSKEKDIKIEENIIYSSGKFELGKGSEIILNKVVDILKSNPPIKLDVISHTDAIGDDAENISLSMKRSNSVIAYIISKGIDKSRLIPIGKGETEIRNRCKNNIECTNEEHAYNRRTEFHFIK